MNKQIEREYREALDHLRFSKEAKERMMKSLIEQREWKPAKRRGFRPLRAGLIAAAVCAALLGTAFAADLIARQASIRYIDRDQFRKEYNEYLEEHGYSSNQYNDSQYSGMDFRGTSTDEREKWWEGPAGELVEETAGTPEDGWTAKRVFRCEGGWLPPLKGKKCLETRYRAECVSDYDSLWDCWDLSWLEAHYAANPDGPFARAITYRDELYFMAVGGEYWGKGDTKFNLSYSWNGSYVRKDEFRVSGNMQYAELYTTPDGVEVAIEMDTSETGKSVFWVDLWGGHSSFSMFGTQMGLDDLHDILDSLNLSKLLEYDPTK